VPCIYVVQQCDRAPCLGLQALLDLILEYCKRSESSRNLCTKCKVCIHVCDSRSKTAPLISAQFCALQAIIPIVLHHGSSGSTTLNLRIELSGLSLLQLLLKKNIKFCVSVCKSSDGSGMLLIVVVHARPLIRFLNSAAPNICCQGLATT